jgi:membrane fusion protein (multidrug efflux system)
MNGPLPGALVLLALLGGCGKGEARSGGPGFSPEARVEVVLVDPEPLRDVVEIPGQLESEQGVAVGSEIEGIVASIEFQEGQTVATGDVLVRLRDEEQRARLAEAEAQLALAREVYQRTQELVKRNISSAAQFDRAVAELGVARARVEVARLQVERTDIRAPFAGVVGARLVSVGERVREETPLAQLDAIDKLQLVFSLPEVAVAVVHPGLPVHIRVAPFPDEFFEGEVFFVSPTLDPVGRRIVLKAWIPNPGHRLRPGLFATIEAEVSRREDALLVPESAVVQDLDGVFVWRVSPERKAERVNVELGLHVGGRVEVRNGLEPGDRIVFAGTHKVKDGGAVTWEGAAEAHAAGSLGDGSDS